MISRSHVFVAGFTGALVAAGAAEAQTIPSPYRFIDTRHDAGAFIASVPGNRGELELGPGGGVMFGGRYGIELGGPFALEGTAFLLPTDRRIRAPGEEEIEDHGTTTALVGGLDARIRFTVTGPRTWRGLAPFLLAGGGIAGNLSGPAEIEGEFFAEERFSFGPSFLGVLGAGTRWLPGERVTVRADATLHLWKLGTPSGYMGREEDFGQIPQQEWTGVPAFSIGLSYRF